MAVTVTEIGPNGTLMVEHTEAGCTGTLTLADLSFGAGDNTDVLIVPCPDPKCGAVSAHPITGGDAQYKDIMQQVFAVMLKAHSGLSHIDSYEAAVQHVADQAEALGEGYRCTVTDTADPAPEVVPNSLVA